MIPLHKAPLDKKVGMLPLDNASAAPFKHPGRCSAVKLTAYLAQMETSTSADVWVLACISVDHHNHSSIIASAINMKTFICWPHNAQDI